MLWITREHEKAISELPLPLFQKESWCTTIHMETSFTQKFIVLQTKNSFPYEMLCNRTEAKGNSEMAYSKSELSEIWWT